MWRYVWSAVVLCSASAWQAVVGSERPTALPGTKLLTIAEPLDEVMVAGISRYALRALEESQSCAGQAADDEGDRHGVEVRRARFRSIIGAVNQRLPPTGFEIVAPVGGDGVVARSAEMVVYAVRWPVLEGVYGEGLLLQPTVPPVARAIAIPDAGWTPEAYTGLTANLGEHGTTPLRLAAAGVQVLAPAILSREMTYSGSDEVAFTNQPHREFIYRQAFSLGRHPIGYEVEMLEAAVDELQRLNELEKTQLAIGVVGVGEGGLLALYTTALDARIDAVLASGYFQRRTGVWEEPIYRNVWGLLTGYSDAELASVIAPRPVVVEACAAPTVAGPPDAPDGRRACAAPGVIKDCPIGRVRSEFDRAKSLCERAGVVDRLTLVVSADGDGPSGSDEAIQRLMTEMEVSATLPVVDDVVLARTAAPDTAARQRRQVKQLSDYTQQLMRLSPSVRDEFWRKASGAKPHDWRQATEYYRNHVWEELIGKLPEPTLPPNVRTRRILDDPAFSGYEVAIDVYPDVIAAGILLVPEGLQADEKRPVVVCQHGLEGLAIDTISRASGGFPFYKAFAGELARRGFIVYAPQNPYRGGDKFRVIQRQLNPLKLSLFSFIIRQHERTLQWLRTLPHVDGDRIGFYGLSYGGKTAMRVPTILRDEYALSICSGDFNDWVRKMSSIDDSYSYVFTPEYEMPEWNLAHIASYAELANLMAPRPFMIERGHDDGVAPDEWVAAEYAKVKRHYDRMGLGERTAAEFFNGPHTIDGKATFRFLETHLH